MIRVILIDDEAAVRRGIRLRLELEPDMGVVGESGNPLAAATLARELAADVAVIDIEMPGMSGLRLAAWLRDAARDTSVVILSLHDDDATRAAAMAAGAFAFVSKSSRDGVLVSAIRAAAATGCLERP